MSGRSGRAVGPAWVLAAALLAASPAALAQSAATLYDEALALRHAGDFEGALDRLAAAARLEPGNADILLLQGLLLGFTNRLAEAEATLRRGLDLAPGYTDLRLALARVMAWREGFAEAERLVQDVLAAEPDRADALELAGRIAWYRGELDHAERHFLAARQARPDSLDALVGLGDVADARGRSEEARGWWRQAQAVAPDSRDVQARLDRQREPDRPTFRLDLGGSYSRLTRTDLDPWREGAVQLGWQPDRRTTLHGRVEAGERFDEVDVHLELGAARRFNEVYAGSLAVGWTPASDFREDLALTAEGGVRLTGPAERQGPLRATLQLRTALYGDGPVHRVAPGLRYDLFHGQASLAGRLVASVSDAGGDVGWLVQGEWLPAGWPVGLGLGVAQAPETIDGVTRETEAVFGHLRYLLDDTRELRLDLAREDREDSYRRRTAALNLTFRF